MNSEQKLFSHDQREWSHNSLKCHRSCNNGYIVHPLHKHSNENLQKNFHYCYKQLLLFTLWNEGIGKSVLLVLSMALDKSWSCAACKTSGNVYFWKCLFSDCEREKGKKDLMLTKHRVAWLKASSAGY